MSLISVLEAGRADFLDATSAVTPAHAGNRPAADRWSVLECIEHVIAVESRYLNWIETGPAIPPRRDPDKELRLFTTVRNRLTKVLTRDVFHPHNRLISLEAAIAEFTAVRDRTVQVVRERAEEIYAVGTTHPYFGNVNGAELIQLIDGHARRHADQIRETSEALRKRPERRTKSLTLKKPASFRRDPPDLPPEFDRADAALAFAGDEVALVDVHLQSVNQPALKVSRLAVEGSLLEHVQFADGQFGSAVWKDVRLVNCDLANVRAHRLILTRVEFVDCRLTGFSAASLEWQDVLIRNTDLRYAQLAGGAFRNCEFQQCECAEADFQNADLSGSVIRTCRLTGADLQAAKLRHTDFRGSEIEGMLVGLHDLRGAVVDAAQAIVLARLLGVEIR